MRQFTRIGPLIGLVALLLGCATAPASSPQIEALTRKLQDNTPAPAVMVIAHRGCWRNAPENSIAAIKACIKAGVDMIEIDVRSTRDGQLVLMHDATIDRTTNGQGLVADIDKAVLDRLRLRQSAGGAEAPVTEHRVPTLEEALQAARGQILVNLDLKVAQESHVTDLVERMGMSRQILMKMNEPPGSARLTSAPFLGRSFFMPIVAQCERLMSPPCSPLPRTPLSAWKGYGPVAYELVFPDLAWFEAAAAQGRALGTRIWVNTLSPQMAGGIDDRSAVADPEATWGRLIAMGASMIQTDEPELLVNWLRERERQPSGTK